MAEKLRSGYTTGTHATATLVACLEEYFEQRVVDTLEVLLPKEVVASIEVTRKEPFHFSTIKGDNDDIDVTKGAKISCQLFKNIPQNLQDQTPSIISFKHSKLHIWAGKGVGVVTKKGLKITPNHPAINPVPLEMMQENILPLIGESEGELHAVFSVEDGEKIAKETANAKVGVIGGISILGTRGIVKPISASAYLESIKTEINVASKNADTIVFTLGNTAHDKAKQCYDEVSIVEIGNFVYDAMQSLKGYNFKKIVFITSSAKMSKVAQGFKNTHNRFGSIDFTLIQKWLLEVGIVYEKESITLKAILDDLKRDEQEKFLRLVVQKAKQQIARWLREGDVEYEVLNFTIASRGKDEFR